jgi:putative redox protein
MSRAKVKFVDGLRFVGEAASGHSVVMDGDLEVGGNDTAIRPSELLLVGLGGCTGMDVISILRKKRQPVTGLEISIKGEKADNHPKRYTDVEVEFTVTGKGVDEEAVKRAVELSMERYCSVKATFEGSAKVGWSYKVVEE